ncbi:WD40-repeat-containing domain protein [Cunninghamella echinulata]|nr:WD40-repeat-containing domain protein [Cunninghamella echinulata]
MLEHKPKNKLQLSKTIGGDMSQCPVEFTKDSKYFFSGVGSTIKIYSIQTGSVVKVLSKPSVEGAHQDKVTMVLLNPKNHLQLLSASLDGTIKLWDYNDEVLLKTYNVNEPIVKLVLSPNDSEFAYVLTKSKSNQPRKTNTEESITKSTKIYQFNMDLISTSSDVDKRLIAELDKCTTIAISANGEYLAMGAQYQLHIWQINELTTQLRTYTIHEGITQLEFHPVKNYLAIGQRTGRITFYYCFTEETIEKPVTESHHWHHKEVKSLKFMDDGMYLLSGGRESVLVIWQLETNNKRFYPRIGGDINFINITPDYQHYCVSISDNSIRFINAFSQSMEQVIQGVQQEFGNTNELIMVEPKNNHLVLTKSERGSIQFYDPKTDNHILDMGIIPHHRNTSSADRSQIKCVSFSCSNGEWMATVDMRNDGINTLEVFLKFWHWDHDQQTYVLHTRVDNPHQDEITSLTFHPTAMMAITTSLDNTFKVWHFSNELGRAHIDVEERAWTCRSIGMYRQHCPEASAFSMDGSMLAVAFGSVITIWDPYQNIMQGVLPTPETNPIKSLHFINDTPYLISRTESDIFVWNLLTCSVWWNYHMETSCIAVDPNSNRFVVSAVTKPKTRYLILFNAYSPKPLLVHKLDSKCNGIAWIPSSSSSSNNNNTPNSEQRNENKSDLVYLLPDRFLKIMKVLDNSKQEKEEELSKVDTDITVNPLPQVKTPTLFNDAYGTREQQKQEQLNETTKRIQDASFNRRHGMDGSAATKIGQSVNKSDEVMSAPSHVLPSVDSLFNSFMNSLMNLKLPSKEETGEMDWNEEKTTSVVHDNDNGSEQQKPNDNTAMVTDLSLSPIESLDAYFESLMGDNQVLIDNTADSSTSEDQSESDDDSDVEDIKW